VAPWNPADNNLARPAPWAEVIAREGGICQRDGKGPLPFSDSCVILTTPVSADGTFDTDDMELICVEDFALARGLDAAPQKPAPKNRRRR
jgi:hypothetical protein